MDLENQPPAPEPVPGPHTLDEQSWPDSPPTAPDIAPYYGLHWIFVGEQGLRAGWSVGLFIAMFRFIGHAVASANRHYHFLRGQTEFTASSALSSELVTFVMVLFAAGVVALIEHRSLLDFNLRGPRRLLNFFSGLAAGFVALSTLVWTMDLGGWLHFGPEALSGAQIFRYAALWGGAFLLVGFVEEGTFRCYFQATLTRGINFWWALAMNAVFCLDAFLRSNGNEGVLRAIWLNSPSAITGNGAWGVYLIVLLGLVPCALLHLKSVQGSGFWQAAWVTSAMFGFIHTGNNGENWIGIFAAAFIGFVFCVSVWVTGSAWWAIGCHAAWDWAETYFYGTADSGFVAKGHFLSTSTNGNPLWSGGTDGPEGSLLVIAVCLLLLAALLVTYSRREPASLKLPAAQQCEG